MNENKIENQTADSIRKYLGKPIIDEILQGYLLENDMGVDGREVPV